MGRKQDPKLQMGSTSREEELFFWVIANKMRPATRIGYSALFHITRPHETSACCSKVTGTWNFQTKLANRLYLRSQPSTGLPELEKDLEATLEISAFPDLRFRRHAPNDCHLGSWFPRLPFSILSRLRHNRDPLAPHIGSPSSLNSVRHWLQRQVRRSHSP